LVEAMLAACANPDPMVGLGALCLGAEAIVPHVYSQILRGFLAVGIPAADLIFFKIHIEDDDAHAVTMRALIDREIARDAHRVVALREAARKIIAARTAFFRDLNRVPTRDIRVVDAFALGAQP
jgi:hypothetical protein